MDCLNRTFDVRSEDVLLKELKLRSSVLIPNVFLTKILE